MKLDEREKGGKVRQRRTRSRSGSPILGAPRGAERGGEGARAEGRGAWGGSAHRLGQIVRLMGFRVTRKRRFNDQLSLSFCRSRCPPCRGYPMVSAGLTAGQHDGVGGGAGRRRGGKDGTSPCH